MSKMRGEDKYKHDKQYIVTNKNRAEAAVTVAAEITAVKYHGHIMLWLLNGYYVFTVSLCHQTHMLSGFLFSGYYGHFKGTISKLTLFSMLKCGTS